MDSAFKATGRRPSGGALVTENCCGCEPPKLAEDQKSRLLAEKGKRRPIQRAAAPSDAFGRQAVTSSYTGPPMTLGNAAMAGVRLIVWCRDCHHLVEPDPAEQAEQYGAETTLN
jgi:hypothetical protein